ncbi:alpha/beta-hydrolase [Trichodelitschia bisporula]|uniref:Alpha/beta-hydrolase n=1 Tax=Trichodelitschia bisporula TaxID=703511 RepID=A0A6G1IAS6_9PEZI|nr:alpha/beta-hydrolase [Trichodelitschia bisporula]
MRSTLFFLAAAGSTLAQAPACAPLHVVYARATTEPPQAIGNGSAAAFEAAAAAVWSRGYGAAGFSFLGNLTSLVPGTTGYPVHYPANFQLNASAPRGVADMIAHLEAQAKACPKQLFALGGHSQGAGVTVAAVPKIPANILSRVVAVAMFGGPACPASVASKCKSYCNTGDTICDRSSNSTTLNLGALAKGMGGAKGAGGLADGLGGFKGFGGFKGTPRFPKGVNGTAIGSIVLPKGKGFNATMIFPKGFNVSSIFPKGLPKGLNITRPAPKVVPARPAGKGAFVDLVGIEEADECPAVDIAEKGHTPKSYPPESAHTVYNKDGYYIKAAACFVAKQYKAAAGTK